MKRIVLICCLLTLVLVSASATSRSEYTEEERRIIKVLKKKYKIDEISFEQSDNLRYILIYNNKGEAIVADGNGKTIIPPGHFDYWGDLVVNPSEEASQDPYNPGNKDVFCIKKAGKNTFFDVDGNMIAVLDGELKAHNSINVYYQIIDNGKYVGITAKDGRILLEPTYSDITLHPDGICFTTKDVNGISLVGANSFMKNHLPNIPCAFHEVVLSEDGNEWLVRIHEHDTLKVYSPDLLHSREQVDKGIELFTQQRYAECRDFYMTEGKDIAWANFYIGASYVKEIELMMHDNHECVNRLDLSDNNLDSCYIEQITCNLLAMKSHTQKASNALEGYYQTDSTLYSPAERYMNKLALLTDDMPVFETHYNNIISAYRERCEKRQIFEFHGEMRKIEEEKVQLRQKQLDMEKEELRIAQERQELEESDNTPFLFTLTKEIGSALLNSIINSDDSGNDGSSPRVHRQSTNNRTSSRPTNIQRKSTTRKEQEEQSGMQKRRYVSEDKSDKKE